MREWITVSPVGNGSLFLGGALKLYWEASNIFLTTALHIDTFLQVLQ